MSNRQGHPFVVCSAVCAAARHFKGIHSFMVCETCMYSGRCMACRRGGMRRTSIRLRCCTLQTPAPSCLDHPTQDRLSAPTTQNRLPVPSACPTRGFSKQTCQTPATWQAGAALTGAQRVPEDCEEEACQATATWQAGGLLDRSTEGAAGRGATSAAGAVQAGASTCDEGSKCCVASTQSQQGVSQVHRAGAPLSELLVLRTLC